MNLIWIDDFLALAESGNFTRAAGLRCSSQPAFSRRIRALEDWLGTALVDRSTQPVRLTEAGIWFQEVALQLQRQVARLPDEARQVADRHAGTVRVASTHALSVVFLPRWLRQLEAAIAINRIEWRSDVLARCEVLMQQGQVHLVLGHAHPQAPGSLDTEPFTHLRVGSDALVPVSVPNARGAPRHTLRWPPKSPLPLLAYTDESGLGRICTAVVGPRLRALPIRSGFTAHLASVLHHQAREGRGLAWLPRTLVQEDLQAGRLVLAGGEDWTVPLEIRLYRDRSQTGATAEAMWAAAAQASDIRDAATPQTSSPPGGPHYFHSNPR